MGFVGGFCVLFVTLWGCLVLGVLFNNPLNIFYLRLHGVRYVIKDHWDSERKPTGATPWAVFDNLYAPYHGLGYTSYGALAGTRNSSMGLSGGGVDPTTHHTTS